MPIPAFREDGWLPDGHHGADWPEIIAAFGGEAGSRRQQVMAQLLAWRDAMREKGIGGRLVLDGSFTSVNPNPSDFDCVLVYDDSTAALLSKDVEAQELLRYERCKALGFDVFIFAEATVRKSPQWARLDVFDCDKVTGKRKGVVEVVI